MTRLLIGLTGGLYTFDLVASGGRPLVLPGVQPMAFATDPSEPAQHFDRSQSQLGLPPLRASDSMLPQPSVDRPAPRSPRGETSLARCQFNDDQA